MILLILTSEKECDSEKLEFLPIIGLALDALQTIGREVNKQLNQEGTERIICFFPHFDFFCCWQSFKIVRV